VSAPSHARGRPAAVTTPAPAAPARRRAAVDPTTGPVGPEVETLPPAWSVPPGGDLIGIRTQAGGVPSLQAKLQVAQPGDPHEREAENAADRVGRERDARTPGWPHPPPASAAPSHPLWRPPTVRGDAELRAWLGHGMDTGRPLPHPLRTAMETSLGHPLDGVRVHTGAGAASVAASLNAEALTHGPDIYFAAGRYQPDTHAGRRLLAHELTHTLQQSSAILRQPASAAPAPVPAETPELLARRLREAFRGLGTDEEEVYRVLSFPPAMVRQTINYYNERLNDHTGKGLEEDVKDEFSGDELDRAQRLLSRAGIRSQVVERKTRISSRVPGDRNKVWVGLIVRGMWSPAHEPGVMEQHADVVVPTASGAMRTRGFFGNQAAGGSGSGLGRSAGIGLPGRAPDFDWFLQNRPQYVDLEYAKLADARSSLILVKVTRAQAAVLDRYWRDLQRDPGTFHFLGRNCSTAAAAGFEQADVAKEISGLDTPDNLFRQLQAQYPDAYMISGYFGYTRAGRRYRREGGVIRRVHDGVGPWQGPFVVERRLR
jgi:hypothetical protein